MSLLGISAREQAGVTTDLGQDPTLVRKPSCLSLMSTQFLDLRHTPTLLAQTASMRSTLSSIFFGPSLRSVAGSAVFYQDQSKRKETRMILFYVCTRCNHNFQDTLGGPEAQISEDNPPEP